MRPRVAPELPETVCTRYASSQHGQSWAYDVLARTHCQDRLLIVCLSVSGASPCSTRGQGAVAKTRHVVLLAMPPVLTVLHVCRQPEVAFTMGCSLA